MRFFLYLDAVMMFQSQFAFGEFCENTTEELKVFHKAIGHKK
jgi:hypothetical protein